MKPPLTIDSPWSDEPEERIVFALGTVSTPIGTVIAVNELTLTDEACDLFNGAYAAGAIIDRAVITLATCLPPASDAETSR